MICKHCKKKITLVIANMPDDECWDCIDEDDKKKVVSKNLEPIKKFFRITRYN